MSVKEKIDKNRLPKHVAIIMDGNGRWAQQKGNIRIFGHRNAIAAVRDTIEAAAELGVGYLTLYAFSTENWNRPKMEVDALMSLLVETIGKELPTLQKNNLRLHAIGLLDALPGHARRELQAAIQATAANTGTTVTLALSYGSRVDLQHAVQKLAAEVAAGTRTADSISQQDIAEALSTKGMPDPELLIRTSGEHRISNFLLWEIAYAEIYFTPTLWPDFRREHFYEAVLDFQRRERRFGMTGDQIKEQK